MGDKISIKWLMIVWLMIFVLCMNYRNSAQHEYAMLIIDSVKWSIRLVLKLFY